MRWQALWRARCPHCLKGSIFINFWRMHEDCPVCGIHYEREDGYFMMAVFVGYVINFAILVPMGLILYFQGASAQQFLIAVGGTALLLAPFIFRYARVIWLHIDEVLDPRS